ncbi:MAG: phosphoglucosamine mutase [candidate division Zixibacteria bacterium]|nr:phosphoglucosamine mutase [candidate division Zixibacteria bacterium]
MAKPKLVKSTSGIRGVIGHGLDPVMVTAYGAAFGTFLKKGRVVVGRDSRPSGDMITRAVVSGLVSVGIDVIDIGIVPTPTVEIAVKKLKAAGGVCVTASHNPAQWNALKFFNSLGEFITAAQYKRLDSLFNSGKFAFQPVNRLGKVTTQSHWIEEHIRRTLAVKTVNRAAIKRRKFKVVVDAVNGAGSVALPLLLKKLGAQVIEINCAGDGNFVRGPEPVAKNLGQLARAVKKHGADLGLACDPDADRLALVDEKGRPIGEELTLTIAVREVLKKTRGATVINLSTSSTTADVVRSMGSRLYYSKVGEANVVEAMRARKAVIGGEGNGGVIYPVFHAGRDALIAAALVLSALAEEKTSLSGLVGTLPKYYNIKSKELLPDDFTSRLKRFEKKANKLLGKTVIDRRDGLRFDFNKGWLQIRSSNTEPIFRLIVETSDKALTSKLLKDVMSFFKKG